MLETRVAPFHTADSAAHRGNGDYRSSPAEHDVQSSRHSLASSPPGPSNPYGNAQYAAYAGYPAGGLALPGQMNGRLQMPTNGYGVKPEPDDPLRLRGGMAGPSSPPDVKPVIPKVEAKVQPDEHGLLPGDEIIDSDLDDSDDDELRGEGEEEDEGEVDIVFCVYDKVSCSDGDSSISSTSAGTKSEE